MSTGPSKIQKFEDFKPMKKKWKLNKLFIKGSLKGSFFQRKRDFEIVVSFTVFKNLIIDIHSDDINIHDKRLGIDFVIGDNINKVREWVDRMGYKIDVELIR